MAFYPERTSSSRAPRDITESRPKIAGGVDAENTRTTALVYGEVAANEAIPAHDAAAAEAMKLSEGVYRDVNITFANELARPRGDLGIDVTKAIDVVNTQPYCDIHAPSPGVGGHCILWYPCFVTNRVAAETPLLLTVHEVDDSIPAFTTGKPHDELATTGREIRGVTAAILGITHRSGITGTRVTPATGIIDRLNDLSATVLTVDLVLSDKAVVSFGTTPVSLSDLSNRAIDAAVVVIPHEESNGIDWATFDDLVVVDGRGTLSDIDHHVYEIGGGP